MKQKILFYGNCQLGGVSNLLDALPAYHEHYEVLSPENYDLPSQYGLNFSVAAHQIALNHDPIELSDREVVDLWRAGILRALNDADILVFHATEELRFSKHFATDYLLSEFAGRSVCVPSFYFTSFFGNVLPFPMLDLFVWLRRQGNESRDIYEFFANENHPIMARLIRYYYQYYMDGLRLRREKISQKYTNIAIESWVEENWADKLLSFKVNHPSTHYYCHIVNELINVLDLSPLEPVTECRTYIAGPDGYFYPSAFRSFRENLPGITEEYMQSQKPFYDQCEEYSSDQLDRFVELGVARAECYLDDSVEKPKPLEKALQVIALNE